MGDTDHRRRRECRTAASRIEGLAPAEWPPLGLVATGHSEHVEQQHGRQNMVRENKRVEMERT